MANAAAPTIVDVAQQIVDDIRRRKLRRGDPYLNTAETAQLLRVSGSTVNRALQLLAQRGVIQRRQRQGTFIAALDAEAPLRRVHVVIRQDHLRTEGLWADGVLLGMQGALPGVELQFNFRPLVDEADYVNQLIGDVLRSRQAAGFVLIRSTVMVQRLVAASGLPAVVSGTLQPSVRDLPSVERDQAQIGRLLAEHLVERRCGRFLILFRDRITAGDHVMLDGALAVLAQAGVDLARIVIRCLPSDEEAIAAALTEVLEPGHDRWGVLCRSELLARGADVAAAACKFTKPRTPAIVVADVARGSDVAPTHTCIETTITPAEWGAELGRSLAAAARGVRPDPYRKIIHVRLLHASDRSSASISSRRPRRLKRENSP
ncbi:MAG: GntR family transcriptional regulator [Planctomycetaceae bacterium]|nr:GntR family transcriptional regulator [Planctomycetaceae bacterium]